MVHPAHAFDPFFGRDDFCKPGAEFFVDDHHFTTGDEAVVDKQIQGFADQSVQGEHRTLSEGKQVADAQLRMHEDTLKVLAVGRQHLAMQLKSKLESINPIN